MFRWPLIVCLFVLVVSSSPAHALERYIALAAKFRQNAAANTVPANPCLSWGCPSFNTACAAGTTGPAGATAAGCVVLFVKTVINLNLAVNKNAGLVGDTTNAQVMVGLLKVGAASTTPTNGVALASVTLAASGTIVSISAFVTCVGCTAATLTANAKNLLAVVPPYEFGAAMASLMTDATSCMATDAVAGVCPAATNLNTVAGNPPDPATVSNGSSSVSIGVVIGAVVGGIVGLLLVVGGIYMYKKRNRDFSTNTRNISSSTAGTGGAVVSGPIMANTYPASGGATNFNNPSPRYGAQQPQVQPVQTQMANNPQGYNPNQYRQNPNINQNFNQGGNNRW
jgi:hypothetical protein